MRASEKSPVRTGAGSVRLLGLLMLLALATWAPRAAAKSAPPPAPPPPLATIPAVNTVQLGPIKAADGFSLYLADQDCGSADPYFQATFVKGSGPDVLSHTYSGPNATCAIASHPAGVTLRVSVAHLLNIAVHVIKLRRALRHPGLPVGCGPPYGPELPATASGRIDVAIHTGVFGRIAAAQANAQIFSGAPQQCPPLVPTTGREFTAEVGPYILDANQLGRGPAQLAIVDEDTDNPSPDLQGTLELQLGGGPAYTPTGPTGSARVGAATALTSGSLSFSALPACPGYEAQNGELGGSLTINDPLLGPLVIVGADASEAFTGEGTALPGSCNGPGSEPVQPSLMTSCNLADSECSVQADTSTATFFDETSPGTQTITSEVVNFGDGSAPVAIANYGSVEHTYASAGNYTATLTVTDQLGQTFTSSTPVVIDP